MVFTEFETEKVLKVHTNDKENQVQLCLYTIIEQEWKKSITFQSMLKICYL